MKLGNKVNVHQINQCPLCGEIRFEKVMTCTDHYATGETFDVCKCMNCGFEFTQGVPNEAHIGRYYESPDYISHTDTRRGMANRIYHAVRRYMLHHKAHLIRQSSGLNHGRLLDIGTGTGYFGHYMQSKGWKVCAIEKSPQARDFSLQHFGLKSEAPEYLEAIGVGSFDVITLWHVMEHLHDLNHIWKRLYELLDTQGILVVAVPNALSYDARRYGPQWAAYDTPRHIWHFTPSSMQQFGAKHGFILSARHPMPFDAFYISVLSEKYCKNKFPFLKGMYAGTKAWIASLARKEKSSSMIYIFRKK